MNNNSAFCEFFDLIEKGENRGGIRRSAVIRPVGHFVVSDSNWLALAESVELNIVTY